jgi:hypothetical protein
MDLPALFERMQRQADAIRLLTESVSDAQAHWRPAPGSWSILEVINHLADEERDDFRTRLELTLLRPDADWPPIDPEGWVTARGYANRGLAESVHDFLNERTRSIAMLNALHNPDWTRARRHPVFGPISAGTLMQSWLAHDLLHLRQLVELHYAYHAQAAAPYSVGYAGDW